jgi:hypothetical protein
MPLDQYLSSFGKNRRFAAAPLVITQRRISDGGRYVEK